MCFILLLSTFLEWFLVWESRRQITLVLQHHVKTLQYLYSTSMTTLMAGHRIRSQVHPTESTLIWPTAAPAGSALPPWKRLELHPVLQRLSFKRLVDMCPKRSRQLRRTMVYVKMCYCEQSDSNKWAVATTLPGTYMEVTHRGWKITFLLGWHSFGSSQVCKSSGVSV